MRDNFDITEIWIGCAYVCDRRNRNKKMRKRRYTFIFAHNISPDINNQ